MSAASTTTSDASWVRACSPAYRRVPLHHCRAVLSLPVDFRARRILIDPRPRIGTAVTSSIELGIGGDCPALAVTPSARLRSWTNATASGACSVSPSSHTAGRLDTATAFPLAGHAVHQRNGALLKPWKQEAEKYSVGQL